MKMEGGHAEDFTFFIKETTLLDSMAVCVTVSSWCFFFPFLFIGILFCASVT